jgi:hypothetical protein
VKKNYQPHVDRQLKKSINTRDYFNSITYEIIKELNNSEYVLTTVRGFEYSFQGFKFLVREICYIKYKDIWILTETPQPLDDKPQLSTHKLARLIYEQKSFQKTKIFKNEEEFDTYQMLKELEK